MSGVRISLPRPGYLGWQRGGWLSRLLDEEGFELPTYQSDAVRQTAGRLFERRAKRRRPRRGEGEARIISLPRPGYLGWQRGGWLSRPLDEEGFELPTYQSDAVRQTAGRLFERRAKRRRPQHSKSDYDVTAIYCPDKDCCYYVLNTEVEGSTIVLRIEPPKNNRVSGI